MCVKCVDAIATFFHSGVGILPRRGGGIESVERKSARAHQLTHFSRNQKKKKEMCQNTSLILSEILHNGEKNQSPFC